MQNIGAGYSYPESATEWRQIIFPGENPKAMLENLERLGSFLLQTHFRTKSGDQKF